ncbi:MAG: MBL fold metallo-hydrolase [Candidatus Azobacteroides sp.]|nr:MBL fold metallo-hydrolase [Candidatus Azobacteroides sp.]
MKIRFLGTGTSTGVPEIGCGCEVCISPDPRDNRLRTSVLLEINGKNILIDCGPDFRQQALAAGLYRIDAVLITHEHYDHVGGLDDLRPFSKYGRLPIFAEEDVIRKLKQRMPYAFGESLYPGVPQLELIPITNCPFFAGDIPFIPIRVMHYQLPVFGYRTGNFAFLTDFKTIPEEEYTKLQNLEVLVLDALREKEHLSHENVSQALEQIKKIKPQVAYFIHMSHHFGLHAIMEEKLPDNVFLPYDGLEISCCNEDQKIIV